MKNRPSSLLRFSDINAQTFGRSETRKIGSPKTLTSVESLLLEESKRFLAQW